MIIDVSKFNFIVDATSAESMLLATVAGKKYDKSNDRFVLPLHFVTALQLSGLREYATVTDTAQRVFTDFEQKFIENRSSHAVSGDQLFSSQREDAWKLAHQDAQLVFSEMRTGKTPTVLAALEEIGDRAYPAVVVCPNILRRQWAEEAARWAPGRSVQIIEGSVSVRRQQFNKSADIYIIGYSLVAKHSSLKKYGSISMTDEEKRPKELNALQPVSVIVDEAHKIKDRRAVQTRAIKAVGSGATYKWALTGTPIANSPMDLWSLLNFSYPDLFNSFSAFYDRYALEEIDLYGYTKCVGIKPEREKEFSVLLQYLSIRRLRKDVLEHVVSKTYEPTVWTEMAAGQKKIYSQMSTEFKAGVASITYATNDLTAQTRLLQFASATPVIEDREVVAFQMPSCKVDALLELLDDSTEPVVVFMRSRKLLSLCEQELSKNNISFSSLKGQLKETARQDNLNAFRTGEVRVILILLSVGAEGLDLTKASTAIYLERSYSLLESTQSEDRLLGINQLSDTVSIIDVVTQGTLEESLHLAVLNKEGQAHVLLKDKEWLMRTL